MTFVPNRSNDSSNADELPNQRGDEGRVPRWSLEQLSRLADQIAAGEVHFPTEVSASDSEVLLAEVHQRRRRKFIRFIARAIAKDIRRSRDAHKEVNDVETNL